MCVCVCVCVCVGWVCVFVCGGGGFFLLRQERHELFLYDECSVAYNIHDLVWVYLTSMHRVFVVVVFYQI